MNILSLDFETTWTQPVNAKQCRIQEIGAVLYDWENKKPLKMLSEFIYEDGHPASPPELVALTGITDEMRREYGISLKDGLLRLSALFSKACYVVAHNGNEFDKVVLDSELERSPIGTPFNLIPWLDTKTDIEYPPAVKTAKLTYLCAEHGFVNPFSHRALFDALSVIKLMERYDIHKMIEQSKLPTVKVIASVSFEKKHLARERGYYWDGENKYWWKSMKGPAALREKQDAPFSVQIRE